MLGKEEGMGVEELVVAGPLFLFFFFFFFCQERCGPWTKIT